MTRERAKEIMQQAQEHVATTTPLGCGSWMEHIKHVITPEEDQEIKRLWETMPGHTCYMDAYFRFLNGEA